MTCGFALRRSSGGRTRTLPAPVIAGVSHSTLRPLSRDDSPCRSPAVPSSPVSLWEVWDALGTRHPQRDRFPAPRPSDDLAACSMRILAALSRAEGKRVLDLCWRHLYLEPELVPSASRFLPRDRGHPRGSRCQGRPQARPEGLVLTAGAASQFASRQWWRTPARGSWTPSPSSRSDTVTWPASSAGGCADSAVAAAPWRWRHQRLHVGRQIGVRSPPDVRSLKFCVALVLGRIDADLMHCLQTLRNRLLILCLPTWSDGVFPRGPVCPCSVQPAAVLDNIVEHAVKPRP